EWSMAWQSNEFVNPNQRGVELPAGCKDLFEVIQNRQMPGAKASLFSLRNGNLTDIPRYVEELYMAHYGVSLVLMFKAAEAILWVRNRSDGLKLSFWSPKEHMMLKPMFQDLFGAAGFSEENVKGGKLVTVPLPNLWLEAAQLVEGVLRGCGATETSEFGFHLFGPGES